MGAGSEMGSAEIGAPAAPELIDVVQEIHTEVSNFSTFAAAQNVSTGISCGLVFILIFLLYTRRL